MQSLIASFSSIVFVFARGGQLALLLKLDLSKGMVRSRAVHVVVECLLALPPVDPERSLVHLALKIRVGRRS